MTGFCRICIPGFRLMFKLLSEATKGPEPVLCTAEQEKAFNGINQALTRTPALSHPNLKTPFILYVAEKHGTALGFLYRSWRRF